MSDALGDTVDREGPLCLDQGDISGSWSLQRSLSYTLLLGATYMKSITAQ